jgi:hypothetical protein
MREDAPISRKTAYVSHGLASWSVPYSYLRPIARSCYVTRRTNFDGVSTRLLLRTYR